MSMLMLPLRDERGSVFWAVLAVLLAVSLLFSSVVFYGIWHQTQNRRYLHHQQAKYLALAAVERTKWEMDRVRTMRGLLENPVFRDSLSHRMNWQSELHPWGAFWRAVCQGKSYNVSVKTDVLLGRLPSPRFEYAIGLFGPPYPLVVAGRTKITGDVALGPAGVTSGRYRGRSYIDSILVRGDIITDPPPARPEFDWTVWEEFNSHTQRLWSRTPVYSDRTLIVDDSFEPVAGDSIIIIHGDMDFTRRKPLTTAQPMYMFATGQVSFSASARLDGRWAIFSEMSIHVKDSARLAGVVLHAPHIVISDQASFSGQAIADTLLEVKGNATTIFPTLLWVKGNEHSAAGSKIILGSANRCEGIVAATFPEHQWIGPYREEGIGELQLAEKSEWLGYLYADGRAELRGSVLGSVAANMLYFSDPPTTYLNWLIDGKVDRNKWDGFAGLPAFFADQTPWVTAELIPVHPD